MPALLWGVAFANIVRGVPIDARHEYTGTFFTLLNPYALLGGLTTLVCSPCTARCSWRSRRAETCASAPGPWSPGSVRSSAALAVAFLVWTLVHLGSAANGFGWTLAVCAVAAAALLGGLFATWRRRDGWAFVGTGLAIVATVAALFVALYPNVMPSSTNPAFSLTVTNASSSPYTLTIMSWVALIFTPIVLAYQAWTYWVFRHRVSGPGEAAAGPASGPSGPSGPPTGAPGAASPA